MFFWGMGRSDLYQNEALRAVIGREMMHNGDYVVPRLYGQPWLTKPPLHYIAIAAVGHLRGGVDEIAARLPSALTATGFAFLVWWLVGRLFDQRAGWLAAMMTTAGFYFATQASKAEMDGFFAPWAAAAILFMLQPVNGKQPAWTRWTLGGYACLTVAMLIKAWPALIFFYGAMIPLWLIRGEWRGRAIWPHVIGLVVVLGAGGAWAGWAIHRTSWDVFFNTVAHDAGLRLSYDSWKDVLESFYHPIKVFIAFMPMSLFAVWVIDRRARLSLAPQQVRFVTGLILLLIVGTLIFSIMPAHASRYTLPMYPAAAILAGLGWWRWLERGAELYNHKARWLAGGVTVAVGVGACAAAIIGGLKIGGAGVWIGVATLGLLAAISGALAARRGGVMDVLICFLIASAALRLAAVEALDVERDDDNPAVLQGRAVAALLPPGVTTVDVFHRWGEATMFYAADRPRWMDWETYSPQVSAGVMLLDDTEMNRLTDEGRLQTHLIGKIESKYKRMPGTWWLLQVTRAARP